MLMNHHILFIIIFDLLSIHRLAYHIQYYYSPMNNNTSAPPSLGTAAPPTASSYPNFPVLSGNSFTKIIMNSQHISPALKSQYTNDMPRSLLPWKPLFWSYAFYAFAFRKKRWFKLTTATNLVMLRMLLITFGILSSNSAKALYGVEFYRKHLQEIGPLLPKIKEEYNGKIFVIAEKWENQAPPGGEGGQWGPGGQWGQGGQGGQGQVLPNQWSQQQQQQQQWSNVPPQQQWSNAPQQSGWNAFSQHK